MKKQFLLVTIMMGILLGFGSMSWAGEASIFDSAENILIRVCTFKVCSNDSTKTCAADTDCTAGGTCNGNPTQYSAAFDVRDSTGALMPVGTFAVNDISGIAPVPVTIAHNPFRITDITDGQSNPVVLSIPDVSLSLDSNSGAVYFFSTNGSVDVRKYEIINLANGECVLYSQPLVAAPSTLAQLCVQPTTGTAPRVTTTATGWQWTCAGTTMGSNIGKDANCSATSAAVPGVCGSSTNNGTFTTLSSTSSGLCANSSSQVKGFTAAGTGWQWTCGGTNGGADSSQCSASLQTYTVTASATGGSISPSGLISAYYNATKSFTIAAPSGYTATVGGTCGGSPATGTGTFSYATSQITHDCSVSATFALTPVNGLCGSANGGTFAVLSSGSSGLCQSGFSVINFTATGSTGPWHWNCQGLYGGNDSPQCNANLQTAPPDLAITSAVGPGVLSSTQSPTMKVTIINHGAGAAGPFNVTVYLGSAWFNPLVGASAIGTVRINGLAPGQSTTVTIPTSASIILHSTYVLTVVADSSHELGDPNTTDNMSEQFLYVL